jgi:protein-tyrosine phosphatase
MVTASGSPTVFHCTAGKDRTGVLAALILSLVDVDDDEICDDYARTASVVPILRARFDQRTAGARVAAVNGGAPDEARLSAMADELLSARAETMHELLGIVRHRHGGAAAWAERNGFAASEIEQLRDTLVA